MQLVGAFGFHIPTCCLLWLCSALSRKRNTKSDIEQKTHRDLLERHCETYRKKMRHTHISKEPQVQSPLVWGVWLRYLCFYLVRTSARINTDYIHVFRNSTYIKSHAHVHACLLEAILDLLPKRLIKQATVPKRSRDGPYFHIASLAESKWVMVNVTVYLHSLI